MGVYKDLESEFDYDIVEDFFNHYSYMSEALDRLIIDLKNEQKYKTNINEIFRIFHNIKSSSSFLKITPLQKLASLSEEILEECRFLEGPASEELVNWLLSVSDQLKAYKIDLENDSDEFTALNRAIIKIPTKLSA